MSLLSTDRYREYLFSCLRDARSAVHLVSAYITAPGIEAVIGELSAELKSLRVLARWDPRDLISGASDLEVYEALRNRGYEFFVNQSLHAKVVLLDDTAMFIGSSNCTAAGLHLGVKGNWEAGTTFPPREADKNAVMDLFSASVLMTDALYEEIRRFVSRQAPLAIVDCTYPPSIAERLQPGGQGLWVRELPWTSTPDILSTLDQSDDHDLRLFGITSENQDNRMHVRSNFVQARCCRWLTSRLREHNGQLYFGEVAQLLHDALLEDPKPYRKDVKVLVSNLLNWASVLVPELFSVDSPHHSQRIRLLAAEEGSVSRLTGEYGGWIRRLAALRRDEVPGRWNSKTEHAAPHKPLFLIAILAGADKARVAHLDRVELTNDLQERFYVLWRALMGSSRSTNIALPFHHLSTDGLWRVTAGNGLDIGAEDARSLRRLEELGAFARVDPELSKFLGDSHFRRIAMDTLLTTYFDAGSTDLLRSILETK